jgi:hypothetical protein
VPEPAFDCQALRPYCEYAFCGKGCFLEFGDDPETFLAVGFTPTM